MAHPYTIPFRNDSGAEIPPFAVMRPSDIVDRDGQWVFTVVKPDTTFARRYLINGPTAVPIDAYSSAADGSHPVLALRENEAATIGDGWGVQASSWKLKRLCPGNFTWHKNSGQSPSGDYRGLFSQEECNSLFVQGTSTIAGGGTYSYTANILRGQPSTFVETTITVSITDFQFPDGEVFPDDTRYKVSWVNGLWIIDSFSVCPT